MMRWFLVFLICSVSVVFSADYKTSVGIPITLEGVGLGEHPLQTIPRTDKKNPVVIRVVSEKSLNKQWVYDLSVEVLQEGEYNVLDYLRRKDGEPLNLPPISVQAVSLLGQEITEPRELKQREITAIGGYWFWFWVALVAWLFGLLAIIWFSRTRVMEEVEVSAERLVDKVYGQLDKVRKHPRDIQVRADFDRLLIGMWMEHYEAVRGKSMSEALQILKNEDIPAAFLRRAEAWIHGREEVAKSEVEEFCLDIENFIKKQKAATATEEVKA